MQRVQLRNLAARAEGRLPASDWRDVVEGLGGAARMGLALIDPLGRARGTARGGGDRRTYPGDEIVPTPKWGWTHAIEIKASAAEVWPWISQVGADRGGFYSYQWLENLAGCRLRNAEVLHPEWQLAEGDTLSLHPDMPPMRVTSVESGRWFIAEVGPRVDQRQQRWAIATWLFMVEPIDDGRCRLVSRYRVDHSADLATRLRFGPALVEPIGAAMDRRMLRGVRERAERPRASQAPTSRSGGGDNVLDEVGLGDEPDEAASVEDRQAPDLPLEHERARLGDRGLRRARDELGRHHFLDQERTEQLRLRR